jgi:predicted transposase/invertase (TIGR01784 family)
MIPPIPSPHDRFFKSAMSNKKIAQAFFETYLPTHICQAIDLNTLVLRKESFVDEELKLAITDLLFSVNFQQQKN